MLVKKVIYIIIPILIIFLIGCSDDKITGPKPNPFEGQWVEEYTFRYIRWVVFEPPYNNNTDILKELTSVISFYSDSFNIKVFDDNEIKLREQFGKYNVIADTIFFIINPNQVDSFSTSQRTLHYKFLTPDSLHFSTISYPVDDSGFLMIIEPIGVVWGAQIAEYFPFFGPNLKNSGTFIKEE